MPDGKVRVRTGGQEAIVDTPALDGEIGVDLDAGPNGEANVAVPSGTHTVHDEEMDPIDDGEAEARPDGGAVAQPRERITLRGTGLSEQHAFYAAAFGILCVIWGAATTGGPHYSGIVAGLALAGIGAKSYFTIKATGGDR